MSDFDKEAERERLREKYADEQADREATQRMSDLLLQGATMTNRHCDTCGDPIFRYEGQEFCPTCQSAGEGAASADGQSASIEEASEAPDPAEEASESEAAARAVADDERADPIDTGAQPSEIRESVPEAGPSGSIEASDSPERPSTTDDRSGARDELERTIATLARRAGAADDPRRAREFLEAADRAAATLTTLNGR